MEDTESYTMALNALQKIISPLAQIAQLEDRNIAFDSSKYITLENLKEQEPRYDGFTKEQILQHCLNFFANETVQLTIEFLDTDVMQIKRDTRFTIKDQMGIIGTFTHLLYLCKTMAKHILIFRWCSWPIYWMLYHQHN